MSKEQIILIGGGGHCKSCIDVIELENKFRIAGILDLPEKIGEKVSGYPIIGNDKDIEELSKEFNNFFITIGQIKSPHLRINIFNKLVDLKLTIPSIISPLAYVSKYSTISIGSIISHFAMINSGAVIGENCIINSRALIEHEVIIGSHTHISTGAVINGQTVIGDRVFIGSNSMISNNVNITSNVIVAAGSRIFKSITKAGTYFE